MLLRRIGKAARIAEAAVPWGAVAWGMALAVFHASCTAAQTAPPAIGAERPVAEAPHPGHAGALPYDPEIDAAVGWPRPTRRTVDRIVFAFAGPIRERVEFSRDLSQACRRGLFVQRVDQLYRAFGPGERPLGVAYGRMAVNLLDPEGRRDAGTVYFFELQDTPRCRVYTAALDAIQDAFVGP